MLKNKGNSAPASRDPIMSALAAKGHPFVASPATKRPRSAEQLACRMRFLREPFGEEKTMQGNIVSAVFDSRSEAERAISEFRSAGVQNDAISIIGREEGTTTETTGSGDRVDDGDEPQSFLARAAAGSGIGALLGVAALAIPGVGPLVAAGAIAEAAVGGAAITGTVIGAAAGGLADVLAKHGVSDEDSQYYGDRINNGGIFVSVDTSVANIDRERAQDILFRAGGHNASRARESSQSTF